MYAQPGVPSQGQIVGQQQFQHPLSQPLNRQIVGLEVVQEGNVLVMSACLSVCAQQRGVPHIIGLTCSNLFTLVPPPHFPTCWQSGGWPSKVFNSPPVVVRPGGVNHNSFIVAINPPGAYHNDCALWLAPLSL